MFNYVSLGQLIETKFLLFSDADEANSNYGFCSDVCKPLSTFTTKINFGPYNNT